MLAAHRRDRVCDRRWLAYRKGAGLAETDERCALGAGGDLLLSGERRPQRCCGMHDDAVEEGKLARGGKESARLRILSGHHDLRAAQAQVERIEQRQMPEQIVARARKYPLEQLVRLRSEERRVGKEC